uniref:Uncharacterized protein n=1 Tax=Geladintestivirus 5 TaxID=3233137 RepID=A0AAU8MJD2_9CAUD
MYKKSLIATTIVDKYGKSYDVCVSLTLEEKLQELVSEKYDLDENIEIESFTFLGQVIVVSDSEGYQYTISYSEM